MKTEMTLCTFSQLAINAGFQDLFDLNVQEIVESGSFADASGDRVLEFKVVKIEDDELETIIEFDEELYEYELVNPDEYSYRLEEVLSELQSAKYEEMEDIGFSEYAAIKANPSDFIEIDSCFYIEKKRETENKDFEKCTKCGNKLFFISKRDIHSSCYECEHNGAWSHISECYLYDSKEIAAEEIERDSVEEFGQCEFGKASGGGCIMLVCRDCGRKENIPFV